MTSPFDPRTWLPDRSGPSGGERSWVDSWWDLTTWWVDPALNASQLAMRPDQLLAQLIDGLAKRFEGQPIDLTVRGRRVRGVLDAIRLLRRDTRSELRVDLVDVDVDGVAVPHLAVSAKAVSIGPGANPTFRATDIEADGELGLSEVVDLVDRQVAAWSLGVDDGGRILARQDHRQLAVHVEPAVRDGQLRLEIRSVRWRGLTARLPGWLRLERAVSVPLDAGWRLTDTARVGDRLQFRLHGDAVDQQLDLGQIRDAVLGTGSRLGFR